MEDALSLLNKYAGERTPLLRGVWNAPVSTAQSNGTMSVSITEEHAQSAGAQPGFFGGAVSCSFFQC
jgi:hypothetical protein